MSRRVWMVVVSVLTALCCSACPSSSSEPGGGSPPDEGQPTTGDDGGATAEEQAPASGEAEEEEAPPAPAPAETPSGESPAAASGVDAAPAASTSEGAAPPAITSGGMEIIEREGLQVRRLVLARNVEDREPVDTGTTYSAAAGGRVYAFIEVDNPARTEATLTISWASAGSSEERGAVDVQVGAMPRWRTWAFTAVGRHRGNMMAIVRDAEGNLLARAPFEVTE